VAVLDRKRGSLEGDITGRVGEDRAGAGSLRLRRQGEHGDRGEESDAHEASSWVS
jgi:hypothetical protein